MDKVIFIIGSIDISGGTYVILQHASYLKTQGYDITIACCIEFEKYHQFKRNHTFWHPALLSLNIVFIDDIKENTYDIAVFTWWRTVYYLSHVNASNYIYFVQSIESRFYDSNDTPLITLVDATYTFGLPMITEANWIKQYLQHQYGQLALLAKNGIRKDLYTPIGRVAHSKTQKLRVLIEGPLGIFFKNTEKAIELCSKVKDIECWLLTSSKIQHYPGIDAVFSQVPIERVGDIYRACDVLVKLSYVEGMFAPPLEMFHCGGTCIVYDVTGHEEYIRHNENGLVIKMDDEEGVIAALNYLKNHPADLQKLQQGALETAAQWMNWEESSIIFHHCLKNSIAKTTIPDHNRHALQVALKDTAQQAFQRYEMTVKEQTTYQNRLKKYFSALFLKRRWRSR